MPSEPTVLAAAEPIQQVGTEIPFKALAIALARRTIQPVLSGTGGNVTEHGYTAFADRTAYATAVVDTDYEIIVPIDVFKSGKAVHRGKSQYYVSFYESSHFSGIRVYNRVQSGRRYLSVFSTNVDQVFSHPNLNAVKSVLSREAGQFENNFVRLARIAGKLVISAIVNNETLQSIHAAAEPFGAGDAVDQYLRQHHSGAVTLLGYRKFDFKTDDGIAILSWDRKPVVTFGTSRDASGKRKATACLGLFQAINPGKHIADVSDLLESMLQKQSYTSTQQLVLKMLQHILGIFDVLDWNNQPQRYQNAEAAAEHQPHADILPEPLRRDHVFVSLYNLKQLEGKTLSTAGRAWRITINSIYRGHDSHTNRDAPGSSHHISATLTLTTAGHAPEKIRIETWGKTYTVTVGAQHLGNRSRAVHTFRNKDFKSPVTPNSFLQTVLKKLGLLDQDHVQVPEAEVPEEFLDRCVLGYIAAAISYTNLSYDDDANEDTYSDKYDTRDVDDDSLAKVRVYMRKFLEHMYPRIEKAQFYNRNLEPNDIGHYTHLSHIGSGGGFNEERYNGDDEDLAEDLDKAANAIFPGDCNLSENEDGTFSIDL